MLLFNRQSIKHWIQRRAADPVRNMALFTSGAMILIAGLMIIMLAERLLDPSLVQELCAALGVLVAAAGSFRALYGYLSMGLVKLLEYFISDQ